ncbi:MAG: methylated-DNA--[protein]-cysteine S-methyltransferase [Acidobacteria bacterium]|nr:MAG: methylated-DNA--[protein]-cysteine S-methyltransferase [Acidobacteriota bacterium]
MRPRIDPRWQQVLARDARADGLFVYAVRSTGIYCRPSCAARRPRAEYVSFHADGAAARAAGFRPCLRCHPDARGQGPGAGGQGEAARRRQFRAATGLPPREWAAAARDEKVRRSLRQGRSVTEAFYEAGFNSSGRFYAAADRALGMLPVRFQRGGAGASIAFACGTSSLGTVLAAESERGVCAILLGDDAGELEAELRRQFPQASLAAGGAAMERRLRQVIALVEAPAAAHALPLDLRGTAFERRVWRALRRVPAGARLSYGELARRLGMPGGARAVARACARNRLAVAVPCHRVVRGDGELAGYRWGVERKRTLLAREQQG